MIQTSLELVVLNVPHIIPQIQSLVRVATYQVNE